MEKDPNDHGMARMQEILSSYYGMQEKQSTAESIRDIDAEDFDVNIYVKELLQRMGLNELLQKDDQLIREIKDLDNSMQMLVYENYNKFISATDTIRKMKNNVANMETEVEKVVQSMDSITVKSESINEVLAPHRSKVEKLIGVRRLLKRLEFIFELPQRLNSAIKQEEYSKATRYFLLAHRILKRYEHITSFKAIQTEADTIVQGLIRTLQLRLESERLAPSDVCEAITLLNDLDSCTEQMRQQFLDWHQQHFAKVRANYSNLREPSVVAFLERINGDILDKLGSMLQVYKLHFLPENSNKPLSRSLAEDSLTSFFKDCFEGYLEVCGAQFRRHINEFGDLQVLSAELSSPSSPLFQEQVDKAFSTGEYASLMIVLRHFMQRVKGVDRFFPKLHLSGKASDTVEASVRFQIDGVFDNLRTDTMELLKKYHALILKRRDEKDQRNSEVNAYLEANTHDEIASTAHLASNELSLSILAQDMNLTFLDRMQQVLRQMQPLVQSGSAFFSEMSPTFSNLIQTQFYLFLKWFNNTLIMYTEPSRAFEDQDQEPRLELLPFSAEFVLFLAFLTRELASEGIMECIQVLIECLPTMNDVGSKRSGSHDPEKDKRKPLDVARMVQVTRETSVELVHHVVKSFGTRACEFISHEVLLSNWYQVQDEPRSIHKCMEQLIEELFAVAKETAFALDEDNVLNTRTSSRDFRRRTGAGSRGIRNSTGGLGLAGNVQVDVERIFAKRIQVYPNDLVVENMLSLDFFLFSICKMLLKHFGELLRLVELNSFALHQIQIDTEFLRSASGQLVAHDTQELDSLLNDLLAIATERTPDAVLMEQSAVVAIVSTNSALIQRMKRM